MTNARQFIAEVNAWRDEYTKRKPVEFLRLVALDALTSLVQQTPVGNETNWKIALRRPGYRKPNYVGGHARRNWQLSVGSPSRTEIAGIDRSAGGQQTIAEQERNLLAVREPTIVWLANPAPYIGVIDAGKPGTNPRYPPWSRQAPQGLIRPTIAAIESKYRRVGDVPEGGR